jgi:hypothetical protein
MEGRRSSKTVSRATAGERVDRVLSAPGVEPTNRGPVRFRSRLTSEGKGIDGAQRAGHIHVTTRRLLPFELPTSDGANADFNWTTSIIGLPRRPDLLAGFALEETRILRAVRSGTYSFAVIPGHLVRYRLLSSFFRLARERGVDVFVYWHDCGWILAKVRDLAGPAVVERPAGLYETYRPDHLVVSPRTFADIRREVRIQAAHCVWNAAPRPEALGAAGGRRSSARRAERRVRATTKGAGAVPRHRTTRLRETPNRQVHLDRGRERCRTP